MRVLAKRSKNPMSREYPVGVYLRPSGNFSTEVWEHKTNKKAQVGTFPTWRQAEYERTLVEKGSHWRNLDLDAPKECFGFTYLITNQHNGRMYVGKKQFYLWDGPVGGFKCTDLGDPWWDPKAWKHNDWQQYAGSSSELSLEISKGNPWDYTYEVLSYCKDKLDLHLTEVEEQVRRDVLEELNGDGEYLYYNKNIAGMLFRPPFKKDEVLSAREGSQEAMRKYYLKPLVCPSCSVVVPFRQEKCSCGINPKNPLP